MYTIHHDCVHWPLLSFHNLFPLLLVLTPTHIDSVCHSCYAAIRTAIHIPFVLFCSVYFILFLRWIPLLAWSSPSKLTKVTRELPISTCLAQSVITSVHHEAQVSSRGILELNSGPVFQYKHSSDTVISSVFKVLSYSYNSFVLLFSFQINKSKV